MAAALLAVLAATAFALGSVLQQKGTLEVPAAEGHQRFLAQILRRPVWLAGGGFQFAGWVLQAIALDKGSLVVVQSLTSLSLVIALPLGAKLTNQVLTLRVWAGAASMLLGIVAFLSLGTPKTGSAMPPAAAWWSATAITVISVLTLSLLGRQRLGAAKALLYGSAAGICFALQASVTKVFVPLVGKGLSTILSSWTIYALMVSAVVGFVLQQSALRTAVLAPAMASSNAVTLFASVVFGVTVFGETLASNGDRLGPALFGLFLALVGVVLLAGSKPPAATQPMPFG
ncbi:MAG: DMT family transporter [Acidimicrobiales bacterium]|jgi:drug/metabolite transporter (DMT)-like permease